MNDVPSYKPRANGQMAPGDPAAHGIIAVRWDEEKQQVALNFEPSEFRSWGFVEAILKMGADLAQLQGRVQQMQQAQALMAQQAMDQRLAQQVKKEILRG